MFFDSEYCLNKTEIVEKRWTQILLNWINKCVSGRGEIKDLNTNCLLEVFKKYKNELCADVLEISFVSVGDVETFLKTKYPLLKLRNLTEENDQTNKLYIALTVLLYHSCVCIKSGCAAADICQNLQNIEMEMILNLCEKLKSTEITIINIESAIKDAYEATYGLLINDKPVVRDNERKSESSASDINTISIKATPKDKSEAKKQPLRRSSSFDFKSFMSPCVRRKLPYSKSSTEFFEVSDYVAALEYDPYIPQKDVQIFEVESLESIDKDKEVRSDIGSSGAYSTEDILELDVLEDSVTPCQPNCTCTRCSRIGPTCGDPGYSMDKCDNKEPTKGLSKNSCHSGPEEHRNSKCKLYCALAGMILLAILIVLLCSMPLWDRSMPEETLNEVKTTDSLKSKRLVKQNRSSAVEWQWQCRNHFCLKTHAYTNVTMYSSLSRCTLLCMGPQLWPYPIGYTHFGKTIIALTMTNLEYKFQSVPSEVVHHYLAEAFKLFLKGLSRLEKMHKKYKNETEETDLPIKRISVQMEVETDPDPRIRLNTEEAYMLKFETVGSRVNIKVTSASFCGVRHGLETLSQLILLDQASGYLITLSEITIKDAPSYRYRGLMLDTGRNYIPVSDIMRTIDAMASCKLNTFHWRISSDTSFPLQLAKLPLLFEYGAYDRKMVYTKANVQAVVRKAGLRGIRVLIEVTAPGPVGRPWSWLPEATCPRKTDNYTCDNILCTRLLMESSVFDKLQILYSEILEMTGVDDIFHLSDGMFSMTNCYQLINDRDGFLDKTLERLKMANKGFSPKLPIIWYTPHLMKDYEAKTWERLGVQLNDLDPNPGEHYLGKFRVIHSTKWDLSCEMRKQRCIKYRTWQEMYAWKSWRNVEVFTIEGGEAVLWTDLVSSGNLDNLLWPRAAAVAERLWSDMVANSSANRFVYMRLDTHRTTIVLQTPSASSLQPIKH